MGWKCPLLLVLQSMGSVTVPASGTPAKTRHPVCMDMKRESQQEKAHFHFQTLPGWLWAVQGLMLFAAVAAKNFPCFLQKKASCGGWLVGSEVLFLAVTHSVRAAIYSCIKAPGPRCESDSEDRDLLRHLCPFQTVPLVQSQPLWLSLWPLHHPHRCKLPDPTGVVYCR